MSRYTYEDPAIGEIIAAIAAIDYALGEYGIDAILKQTTPNKKFDLIASIKDSKIILIEFKAPELANCPQDPSKKCWKYHLGSFKKILEKVKNHRKCNYLTYFLGLIHAFVDPTRASSLSRDDALMTYKHAPLTTAFIPIEDIIKKLTSHGDIYVSDARVIHKIDLLDPPRMSWVVRDFAFCKNCCPLQVTLQYTSQQYTSQQCPVRAYTLSCLLRCLHECRLGTPFDQLLEDECIRGVVRYSVGGEDIETRDIVGGEDIKMIAVTDKNQVLFKDIIAALLGYRS